MRYASTVIGSSCCRYELHIDARPRGHPPSATQSLMSNVVLVDRLPPIVVCACGLLRKKGFVTCTKRGHATGVPCVGFGSRGRPSPASLRAASPQTHYPSAFWVAERSAGASFDCRRRQARPRPLAFVWCRRGLLRSSVDLLGEGPLSNQAASVSSLSRSSPSSYPCA